MRPQKRPQPGEEGWGPETAVANNGDGILTRQGSFVGHCGPWRFAVSRRAGQSRIKGTRFCGAGVHVTANLVHHSDCLFFDLILLAATFLSYAARTPPRHYAIGKSYLLAARPRQDE
jgi:hypothetical protein